MSTNKTPNLGLHSWAGSDRVSRTEINENFQRLDNLKAEDIALSSTQFTEKNVKAALESLKSSGVSGKSSLVTAVIDKGGTVPGTNPRTFEQIEQGIRSIPVGTNTSDATAASADILSGKTAYVASGKVTGTIANRGAGGTVTPTTTDQVKEAGYYSGPISIKGDQNLIAANIVSGKSIFGVTGSFRGKRWASGSIPGGAGVHEVAGLDFLVSKIGIFGYDSSTASNCYCGFFDDGSGTSGNWAYTNGYIRYGGSSAFRLDFSRTSNSFSFRTSGSETTIYWFAFE